MLDRPPRLIIFFLFLLASNSVFSFSQTHSTKIFTDSEMAMLFKLRPCMLKHISDCFFLICQIFIWPILNWVSNLKWHLHGVLKVLRPVLESYDEAGHRRWKIVTDIVQKVSFFLQNVKIFVSQKYALDHVEKEDDMITATWTWKGWSLLGKIWLV